MNVDKSRMTEHIMVNLSLTEQDYLAGNGEGVWVLVDPETKKAHDTDVTGEGYIGILDNDSFYYPGLNHGELLPFEMRGECRPVADFHSFLSELTKLTPEGKELLLRQIAQRRVQECKPPICYGCQFCGDKHSFPEPNDLIETDPENPLLKHYYCCCGDCDLYEKDITGLGIQECEHFKEL